MTDEMVTSGLVPIARNNVTLLLEAGYFLLELGKNQEAEEVFHGVCALIPHSEVPYMALGNYYFAIGRFNAALKAHQKGTELKPESATAHAFVGETYLFLHKHEEALQALDRAIELDPEGSAGRFAKSLKEAHSLGIFG